MKLIFPAVPVGVTILIDELQFDFADKDTRNFVRCLYLNLEHYERHVDDPEVIAISPNTDELLDRIFKPNADDQERKG